MDVTRWKKIKQLFSIASELPKNERQQFLKRECGDDKELRDEISDLLGVTNSGLVNIADAVASSLVVDSDVEKSFQTDSIQQNRIGQRLGAYSILEVIGKGGMGTVFKAERIDDEYHQQVAIKLIHSHLVNQSIIQRFQNERQILANLNHPNISHLIDGGTTESGVPFIVMEYVNGQPILKYCHQNKLTIDQRLALFIQVAQAIAYAHQNLVVHRDIKPENILVTDSGEVKLLDFGIAKIVNPNVFENSELTLVDQRAMTPYYASPEQLNGLPTTTGSDVYSLGVLLFQLLTGVTPYYRVEKVPASIIKAICETDPVKPSFAVVDSFHKTNEKNSEHQKTDAPTAPKAISKIRRLLKGELDSIILKAMQKDTAERYHSVDQFIDDINAYQTQMPISAQPVSWWYRTRKFISRHRFATTMYSLFTISLFVVSIVAINKAWQLNNKNKEIQHRAIANQQTVDFLNSLLSGTDPRREAEPSLTTEQLLDKGLARIEKELYLQPEMQAQLFQSFADIFIDRGLHKQARHALDMLEALPAKNLQKQPLFRAKVYLAESKLARYESRFEKAQKFSLNGLAHAEKGDRSFHNVKQELRLNYANLLLDQLLSNEALEQMQLVKEDMLFPEDEQRKVVILHGLARCYRWNSDYQMAEETYQQTILEAGKVYGLESLQYAEAIDGLSGLYREIGKYKNALALSLRSLEINTQQVGIDHKNVKEAKNNIALRYLNLGDYDKAERLFMESIALAKKIKLPQSFEVSNLASLYQLTGKLDKAEVLFREALKSRVETYGQSSVRVARVLTLLSYLLVEKNEFEEAKDLIKRSREIRSLSNNANKYRHRLEILMSQGLIERLEGRLDKSEQTYEKALELINRQSTQEHIKTYHVRKERVRTLIKLKDFSQAVKELESILVKFKESHGEQHIYTLEVMSLLGLSLYELGKLDRASELLTVSFQELSKQLPEDSPLFSQVESRFFLLKKL